MLLVLLRVRIHFYAFGFVFDIFTKQTRNQCPTFSLLLHTNYSLLPTEFTVKVMTEEGDAKIITLQVHFTISP